MLKFVLPLIILFVLGVGGFYLYQGSKPKIPSQKTSSENLSGSASASPIASSQAAVGPCEVLTKGNIDVPPLYKESITWQQPTVAEHAVSEFENLSTGQGLTSTRKIGCLIKSITTLDFANKTRNFYVEKLSKNGWKLVDTADGPSSFLITYKKAKEYLLLNRLNDHIELFYTQ